MHLEAKKLGLKGIPRSELPRFKYLIRNVYLLLPLVFLIWMVTANIRSLQYAASIAILISIAVSLVGFIGVIWAIIEAAMGSVVAGWASTICIVCFVGGVQLVCLGVIGEYIGKIYMETKARPRYIISERTWAPYERKYHG